METMLEQKTFSCTFLNLLGDLTIVWSEENKEHVLGIIKKKMEQGYVFFTTKKYMFGKITWKSEVTKKDIQSGRLKDIVITDEEFDKMIDNLDVEGLSDLLKKDQVKLGKIDKGRSLETLKKAKTPEEVIESDSVAIRPIRGG